MDMELPMRPLQKIKIREEPYMAKLRRFNGKLATSMPNHPQMIFMLKNILLTRFTRHI
jgi:hypothetical protein